MQKNNVSMQHKKRYFSFFLLNSGSFSFSISVFHLDVSIIMPLSENLEFPGLPCGGRLHDLVRHVYLFSVKIGLCEVSFERWFRNPGGITCRLPGVWLLFLPIYFHCCPFLLNTTDCISPSGDHIIFISTKGNSWIVMI